MTERVAPQELARAKAQSKAGLFMGREQPLARAEQAAGQLFLFDRLIDPSELRAGIDSVSEADLARVGERVLSGPSAVAVLGSKRAAEAVSAFERVVH
jgi:predicted Zn-dependent peptidase